MNSKDSSLLTEEGLPVAHKNNRSILRMFYEDIEAAIKTLLRDAEFLSFVLGVF